VNESVMQSRIFRRGSLFDYLDPGDRVPSSAVFSILHPEAFSTL